MPTKKLICALDTSNLDKAEQLASQIAHHVGMVKLGLEFFCAHGPAGVNRIAEKGISVFLDLKLHDIPNTVAGALKSLSSEAQFNMITVHVAGGTDMLKAVVDMAEETAWRRGQKKPLIVGVTCLTSLDSHDMRELGVITPITDHIIRLAQMAKKAGLDGVVCPSHEIAEVRKECGQNFKIVVPGIRPQGAENFDQKRVMTPKQAVDLGADFIVVGRPITQAADPVQAAQNIVKSLA